MFRPGLVTLHTDRMAGETILGRMEAVDVCGRVPATFEHANHRSCHDRLSSGSLSGSELGRRAR